MRIFAVMFLVCLWPGFLLAADTHNTVPDPTTSDFITDLPTFLTDEDADRYADMFPAGVVTTCLGATSASKVMAAFACQAYTDTGFYVNQASASIDFGAAPVSCADDDTGWVIATKTTTTTLTGNFQRVAGTRYAVDCTSTTEPTIPTDAVFLMQVVLASAAITDVIDHRALGLFLPPGINTHGSTTVAQEFRQWFADGVLPYVVANCLPATSGTTTVAAFQCQAYSVDTDEHIYIDQEAATVTFSGGNTTYCLGAHRDRASTVAGWTRNPASTHYLWIAAACDGTPPAGVIELADVTVAGGAVTVVADRRRLSPAAAQTGLFYARDYGVLCDGTTDDTAALQAAIDAAESHPSNGIVVVPPGVCVSDALTVDADSVVLRGSGVGHRFPQPLDGTVLEASAAVTGAFVTFGSATERFGQGLEHIALDLENNAGSAAVAIDVVSSRYFRLQNVYITGTFPAANTQIGLRLINGTHIYVENLKVNGGNQGIVVQPNNGESINNLYVSSAWVSVVSDGLLVDQLGTGNATNNIIHGLYCETVTTCIRGSTSLFVNWIFVGVGLDGVTGQWIDVVASTRATWIAFGGDSVAEFETNTTNTEQFMVIGRDFVQLPAVDTVLGGNIRLGVSSTFHRTRELFATQAWNPASIPAAQAESVSVTVTNAAVGDWCHAAFPLQVASVAQGGMSLSCAVSAAATATVTVSNGNVGAIDLDNETLEVRVIQGAVVP